MAAAQKKGAHAHKSGFIHTIVLFGLIGGVFFLTYNFLIPNMVEKAVVSLFAPEGFKHVIELPEYKSMSKEARDEERKHLLIRLDGMLAIPGESAQDFTPNSGLKGKINTDYIFDFTGAVRDEKKDGYMKAAAEWIIKAPKLGEEAYVLEPRVSFSVLCIVLGVALGFFVTLILPSSIGLLSVKVRREIVHTKTKIRLQTGFSNEVVDVLCMPDNVLKNLDRSVVAKAFAVIWERTEPEAEQTGQRRRVPLKELFDDESDVVEFRQEVLFERIKESFSDFVINEITDVRDGIQYERNHLQFAKGLKLYMAHHFAEKYANSVTGFAYGGAAILIVIIGIRGLKFIPPTRPSLILGAIFLEGSLLALLAFSLLYTQGEERMDKMLKKMEDASRNQLETLNDVQKDMHKMSTALVDGNSELIKSKVTSAVTEYLANPANMKGEMAESIGNIVLQAIGKVK